MKKSLYCFFILFFSCLNLACDGIVCKSSKKSVVVNYDPVFQSVDVGGSPTYNKNALKAGWLNELFVSEKGFLVLSEQKTVKLKEKENCNKEKQYCQEHDGLISVYSLQTYNKKEGYKYWYKLSEQERLSITDISSRPSRKPNFHAPKCSYSPIGGLLDLIGTAKGA